MKMDRRKIEEVHERIKPFIHQTQVLSSQKINEQAACEVVFKCENFQKTGSFKARGATNSVLCLKQHEKEKGVATHSSGNHGQALAWAAAQQGVKAYIVMPEDAPKVKIEAVKSYGAQVIFCTSNLESREQELKKIQAKTGAVFIPPYDFENTILGQATCAKELIEQNPDLEAIIAPVGGGGLLSGTCLSAKLFSNGMAVYGAEPKEADDAYRSIRSGERVTSIQTNTIADGLRTTLGELTFPIILNRVADILLCSEAEILSAMRLIYERLKIVVEPSSAVALAVVLKNKDMFRKKRLGIIVSGGNVDLAKIDWSLIKG